MTACDYIESLLLPLVHTDPLIGEPLHDKHLKKGAMEETKGRNWFGDLLTPLSPVLVLLAIVLIKL